MQIFQLQPELKPADLPLAPELMPGEPRSVMLSDTCALPGETNGWGPIERDRSVGEQALNDGGPLAIENVLFSRGFGVHAPSDIAFALGGGCSRFVAQIGVDDEMKAAGSVTFELWGDGVKLAESPVLTGVDPAQALDIDVSGVGELRLVVTDAGSGGSDHADWGDAQLTCLRALEACPRENMPASRYDGYELVWADEFDAEGPPESTTWSFETSFVRNEEAQWYQASNALQRSGFLIIEGRRERVPNPNYRGGSGDWKTNRPFSEYTSSSLHTRGKQSFRFGRF